MKYSRKSLQASLALLLLVVVTAPLQAEKRYLNRSFYVPIQFTVCDHIRSAVLYEGEQAIARLPAERIYQFTYYPSLKRMEPAVVQIRVEGVYTEGDEPFVARLAITRDGIHTASKHIVKDVSQDMRKFRFKRDVHRKSIDLKLQCKEICSRNARRLVAGLGTDDVPDKPNR